MPTYDFYLRELLRSELTYLLTYLLTKKNLSKQLKFILPQDLPHIYVKLLDVHITATLLQDV